jgi:hypothetical protein
MPYEGFELGPMGTYRPGRKHVENRKVNRLPNTDNAAEAGGFTRYWLPLGLPGRQAVGVDLSGAADISNAYNDWWIQPGLDYKAGLSETVGFSARVFSDYASANHMDEFFSISSGQSARSGPMRMPAGNAQRPNADAGWKDVGQLAVCLELVHRGGCQLRTLDLASRDRPIWGTRPPGFGRVRQVPAISAYPGGSSGGIGQHLALAFVDPVQSELFE